MLAPMTHHNTVPRLQAHGVRVAASGTWPALSFDLNVAPGELHLLRSLDVERSTALVDILLGIEQPQAGDVRFDGQAWREMSESDAFRVRGQVGRVMNRGNWLRSRTVMDNLLLPLRHHTVLPDDLLREMACDLARHFGLPGLPMLPPDDCPASDLERAACVKAFLGRPQLVFLEHPMEYADIGLLPPLMAAVQQVRRRGGAVVWFTRNRAVLEQRSIPADRRYHIVGGHLLDLERSE